MTNTLNSRGGGEGGKKKEAKQRPVRRQQEVGNSELSGRMRMIMKNVTEERSVVPVR